MGMKLRPSRLGLALIGLGALLVACGILAGLAIAFPAFIVPIGLVAGGIAIAILGLLVFEVTP